MKGGVVVKKFEILYYFDKDNYIKRFVEVEDVYDSNDILHDFAKDEYQIFPDGRGLLTRVNMNKVSYVKVWESKR